MMYTCKTWMQYHMVQIFYLYRYTAIGLDVCVMMVMIVVHEKKVRAHCLAMWAPLYWAVLVDVAIAATALLEEAAAVEALLALPPLKASLFQVMSWASLPFWLQGALEGAVFSVAVPMYVFVFPFCSLLMLAVAKQSDNEAWVWHCMPCLRMIWVVCQVMMWTTELSIAVSCMGNVMLRWLLIGMMAY